MATLEELEQRVLVLERAIGIAVPPERVTDLPKLPDARYPTDTKIVIDVDGEDAVLKSTGTDWEPYYLYAARLHDKLVERTRGSGEEKEPPTTRT